MCCVGLLSASLCESSVSRITLTRRPACRTHPARCGLARSSGASCLQWAWHVRKSSLAPFEALRLATSAARTVLLFLLIFVHGWTRPRQSRKWVS